MTAGKPNVALERTVKAVIAARILWELLRMKRGAR